MLAPFFHGRPANGFPDFSEDDFIIGCFVCRQFVCLRGLFFSCVCGGALLQWGCRYVSICWVGPCCEGPRGREFGHVAGHLCDLYMVEFRYEGDCTRPINGLLVKWPVFCFRRTSFLFLEEGFIGNGPRKFSRFAVFGPNWGDVFILVVRLLNRFVRFLGCRVTVPRFVRCVVLRSDGWRATGAQLGAGDFPLLPRFRGGVLGYILHLFFQFRGAVNCNMRWPVMAIGSDDGNVLFAATGVIVWLLIGVQVLVRGGYFSRIFLGNRLVAGVMRV